jgi:hypothetical protein
LGDVNAIKKDGFHPGAFSSEVKKNHIENKNQGNWSFEITWQSIETRHHHTPEKIEFSITV